MHSPAGWVGAPFAFRTALILYGIDSTKMLETFFRDIGPY